MNLLIWGDTETSPELRHEVPLGIGDPFLYLESDGRRVVVTNSLEDARIASAAPELERLLADTLGRDELIAEGRSWLEIEQEMCVRAAAPVGLMGLASLGVRGARRPRPVRTRRFPVSWLSPSVPPGEARKPDGRAYPTIARRGCGQPHTRRPPRVERGVGHTIGV